MEFNTKVVDSSKNTSSEGISRVHSNKSHNSNGPKSNNHSAANSIYNQQAHQPKLEKLVSGTVFYVGNHLVEIVNYLAEGGFSQIYKCKFIKYANDSIINGESLNVDDYVCLKRVICQSQQSLNELQLEVEVMKRFQNCDRIVKFYDSMAKKKSAFDGSELQDDVHGVFDPNTYYEVFVLMELCSNNSLLEFMNERLQTKLSETEILNIMYDTTKALFHMHSAGLIHKDIKIENVLVDKDWHFKLCDFGSTSKPYPIVSSPQDLAYLSQDIYVHTTPQYRSPEMIDLYKSLPIDEKSDIWALGIFLYKLLFYTTPFEMTGTFAALHSRYDIPVNNYSTKITNLIVIMLSENPSLRPNIYQVFMEIHVLLKGPNHPLPSGIADIYQNGPYNFNKFSSYQTFVHNLQINLANSYQQKKQIDEYMYVNVFDIASKQPYNTGTYYANGKPQEQPQYQSNSNSVTAEVLNNTTQHVPDASRSRSNGERLFNVSKEAKKDSFSDVHVDDVKRHSFTGKDDSASTTHLEDEEDVTKRFPSVDDLAMELDNIADNELKKTETSKSSGSSKGYTSYETLDKNTPITTQNSSSASKSIVEIPTPTKTNFGQSIGTQQKEAVPAKKYKSNNPFPKINTSVAQDSYKNKGFPVKEDFFAYPSSPVQKNFTNQTVEKENDAKNNNPYLNNYSAGNTKTGSSLTNASIHNNSGSQPISPFMGAAQANVPAQTLNRIDEHNYTNRSNTYQNGSIVGNPEKAAIESKTTTKDLIDFSDLKIDVNDSMKKTVLKNKLNDAGELKRKMKEESPIMSEDSSFNDLPGEESNYSTEIDKSVRDPRIKNVLQLRYSEVDTDDVDELPDQQRGKKSLDFRRDIFTEDMDLNGSTESLTPTPDVEYRKKNGLLSSQHRHNSANNGTSGQKSILNDEAINERRTRRSLEFEREVKKASSKRGSDAKEDDYELANGKNKKSVISNTAKEVENVSRSGSMTKQEKRKSLFGKFTKGF